MKLYKYNDEVYTKLPDPFMNTSPIDEETFVRLGGRVEDEITQYDIEFEEACAMFRTLCAQIGQFISNPDFHGGFGEMASFAQSTAYQQNPVIGNTLAIQWTALNEECKYFGSRIGKGQPEWWYYCWELVGLDLHDSPTDENEPEESNESNDTEPNEEEHSESDGE